MNLRSDKEMEALLSEQFAAIDVPDRGRQEELWRRIRDGLRAEEEPMQRRARARRLTSAACALLAAGGLGAAAMQPDDASAFRWFRTLFVGIQSDTMQLTTSIGADPPGEAIEELGAPIPPPQVTILGAAEPMRLAPEELAEAIAFPVRAPAYVPDGYALDHATANMPEDGRAYEVVLRYALDGDDEALRVEMAMTARQSSTTIAFDLEDTTMTQTELKGGVPAQLLTFPDGSAELHWSSENMWYALKAKRLGQDELLRIAESMPASPGGL